MMIQDTLQNIIRKIIANQNLISQSWMHSDIFHFLNIQGIFISAIEITGNPKLPYIMENSRHCQLMALILIESKLLCNTVSQIADTDTMPQLFCDVLLKHRPIVCELIFQCCHTHRLTQFYIPVPQRSKKLLLRSIISSIRLIY